MFIPTKAEHTFS